MANQNFTNQQKYELKKEVQRQEEKEMKKKQTIKKWTIWGVILLVTLGAGFGIFKLVSAPSSPFKVTDTGSVLSVKSDDWVKGNKNAKVILVEYLDFECESCGAYYPLIKEMEKEFKEDLAIVTRYFPLPNHKNSMEAALAAEAAGRQGKYWEMHDMLFTSQKDWGEKPKADSNLFIGYAEKIGLNIDQFNNDRNDSSVKARIERDRKEGEKLNLTGTPSFFLNGEKIPNPKTPDEFKTLIKAAILKAPVSQTEALGEKVHEHADFAVYLDGKKFDFTPAKYQSSKENPLDSDAHLHDGNGEVTHKHRKGITLGYFFKTIGMKFDNQCFVTDTGKQYCNTADKKLKMFVNGKENTAFGNYEFTDLDKILITYGNETGIVAQITSISDDACLYSEKCPERGKPPTENCVGGLGSEC